MVAKQYEWLVADLEAADRPENRSVRPWVVLMGHRPMYCSGVQEVWKGNNQINLTTSATVYIETDKDDCTRKHTYTR